MTERMLQQKQNPETDPPTPEELASWETMRQIAYQWLAAFNEKKIENLLDLYAPDAVYHNPRLLKKYPETGGRLQGREAMREWWGKAFTDMPKLSYLIMGVETGRDEALITYQRRENDKSPETVERELLKIKDGRIIESTVLPNK